MKPYLITITKVGSMEVEAETIEEAEDIARDLEGEGGFFMDIDVNVEELK